MHIRCLPLVALFALTACAPKIWTGDAVPPGRVVARSEMTFSGGTSVRVLRDGRALVVDDEARQIWLLDKDLRTARLIADTTAATNHRYAVPGTYIRPYLGDSTLMVNSGMGTAVILDDRGRPARDVIWGSRLPGREWTVDMIGAPFTKRGDVMALPIKGQLRREREAATIETLSVVRTSFRHPEVRDTVDFLTRQIFKPDPALPVGTPQMSWVRTGDGAGMFKDGTIAIVRTKGYRIEWIDLKGKRWTTQLPHEWVVLSPADKQAAIDTLRAHARTTTLRLTAQVSPGLTVSASPPSDTTVPVTKVSELPDTVPPIPWINQVQADADDHLWIEQVAIRGNPYRTVPGRYYDVVDRKGRLARRVVLPPMALIKAFTPGRVWYAELENGRWRLVVAQVL
jgi:hypothetical protein